MVHGYRKIQGSAGVAHHNIAYQRDAGYQQKNYGPNKPAGVVIVLGNLDGVLFLHRFFLYFSPQVMGRCPAKGGTERLKIYYIYFCYCNKEMMISGFLLATYYLLLSQPHHILLGRTHGINGNPQTDNPQKDYGKQNPNSLAVKSHKSKTDNA